ncbi:hypothetical protein ABLG96_11200 [Nakamurella sp. A5-74]|uniref:DUF1963 domain-containing protein n=1 Tax=Nakamurella sp. A5-74 TaxID=3158264 RepID=A0AAU8DKU1_9ACTN
MKAYDLGFGVEVRALQTKTLYGEPLPGDGAVQAGWTGPWGPAIRPAQWPRSSITGLPMSHALTLRLPSDYQRRGSDLSAISFFTAGNFTETPPPRPLVPDPESDDPFLRELAGLEHHPEEVLLNDIIDGQFALIWLADTEFAAGPVAPPAEVRRPGEHLYDDGGCFWDPDSEFDAGDTAWLVERPDPNAGKTPSESHVGDYRPLYDENTEMQPWATALFGRSHLGGTSFHLQSVPEGLTPYYLELEEIAGLNFGTGNAQIDLESGVFDWAC